MNGLGIGEFTYFKSKDDLPIRIHSSAQLDTASVVTIVLGGDEVACELDVEALVWYIICIASTLSSAISLHTLVPFHAFRLPRIQLPQPLLKSRPHQHIPHQGSFPFTVHDRAIEPIDPLHLFQSRPHRMPPISRALQCTCYGMLGEFGGELVGCESFGSGQKA